MGDEAASGCLLRDLRENLDLTEEGHFVTFRLADGWEPLRVDRRILCARSAYFRNMLASGCREAETAEVDLRSNPLASRAAIEDVLRFLLAGGLDCPAVSSDDDVVALEEHLFRVRGLADQYQLGGLLRLAETRLAQMLSRKNVLSYLGQLFTSGRGRSGHGLEWACWELMEEDGHGILAEQRGSLRKLNKENPELVEEGVRTSSCLSLYIMDEEPRSRRMSHKYMVRASSYLPVRSKLSLSYFICNFFST